MEKIGKKHTSFMDEDQAKYLWEIYYSVKAKVYNKIKDMLLDRKS